MIGLTAAIGRRSFATDPSPLPITLTTERISWRAVGGPYRASITAAGGELALWALFDRLRCPVTIYDAWGEPVWWGFVSDVELQQDAIKLAASLDSMANRIAVAYAYVPEGTATAGTRATTNWAEDAHSIATYGTFERLESSDSEETASAVALRDRLLAQYRYPMPAPTVSPGESGLSATITCRGWWDMFGRRYYDNAGTDLVDTTDQVAAIVAAKGEFITATDIVTGSGIARSEYRDGDTTALKTIEDLLAIGSANSRPMLATVDQDRRVRITEEPAPGAADWRMTTQGRLYDHHGMAVRPGTCPVGIWVDVPDLLPATVDVTLLGNPLPMFVEECEWSEADQVLTPAFRGAGNPLDLVEMDAG